MWLSINILNKKRLLKTVPSLVGACTFTSIWVHDVIFSKTSVFHLQWNLDIINLYLPKSSVKRTIFFTPVIVKCMRKNLNITKHRYSELILLVPQPFVISRFLCTRVKQIGVFGGRVLNDKTNCKNCEI